jgi:HPt (histidine-containing phosphotransfer) domain-containing protein
VNKMIDLTYLKNTTGNDNSLIAELIGIFKSQLPEFKNDIETAYKQRNWQNLKESAHKAKNSFTIVGAEKQAAELKQIEMIASKEENLQQLAPLIENFLKNCEEIAHEINQLNL